MKSKNCKSKDWKDYFRPPFHKDSICSDMVWTANGVHVLQHDILKDKVSSPEELADDFVTLLNGLKKEIKIIDSLEYEGTQTDSNLIVRTKDLNVYNVSIRGWGFLIGCSNRLSSNEAADIQDSFGKYIVEKFNKLKSVST